jgi:ParB family transcriptional regulator, chromosome partitioning protein
VGHDTLEPIRDIGSVESIEAFGHTNPILFDGGDVVIDRHGRLLAPKSLPLEAVPTILLPNLTEAQKRASNR